MARRLHWRHKSPEAVLARAEEALHKTLYIVHQAGPTSFVLREETGETKFKTCLGSPHQCSCGVFRRERELCVHILWLLLKRFKLPRENSLSFQLGLVEREINEILYGSHTRKRHSKQEPVSTDQSNCVVRRTITGDDVCPICQEEFSARPLAITFCKLSCGQNVHMRCMKVWAEHQQSSGDSTVRCPVCRSTFLPLKELCGGDLCVYKPTPSAVAEPGGARNGGRRGTRERAEFMISRLKAHPVAVGGGGEVCEMCGEETKRGDWIRRLPACKHKFHRDCIDGWLRSGHIVCPVDGTQVLPSAIKQRRAAKKGERECERERKDSLSLSGHSIKLPHVENIGMVKTIRGTNRVLQSHDRSHDQRLHDPRSHDASHGQRSHDRSHDQRSRDGSHDPLVLPPLSLSLNSHSSPLHHLSHSSSKKWPTGSAIRRGLPSSLTFSPKRNFCPLMEETAGPQVVKLYPPPPPPPPLSLPHLSHTPLHHSSNTK